MSRSKARIGRRAVVMGASMAGLVAARVLSDYFPQVIVLDRDVLPAGAEARLGVAQGRHAHGLLASGLDALRRLFPSLEQRLLAAGAMTGDIVGSVRWHQHGHDKAKFDSGRHGLLVSRVLLESAVRECVRALPGVQVVDRCHIRELLTSPDYTAVTGVRASLPGESPDDIVADLVVDATGRASRSVDWLAELGYPTPAVDRVQVDIGYTTRIYRRHPADLDGDRGVVTAPKPPRDTRAGFMLAVEGDRWMVSLGGWCGDHAPTDPDGFLAFARTLPRPHIYDVIARAEPLSDAVAFAFPANVRRRYERLRRFPHGYLVVGDALCSFNPIYGQGMSVAALEGLALADTIASWPTTDGLAFRFFERAAAIIDGPWTIAASGDFAFEGVTGSRPLGTSVINWYLNHVHHAAATDRGVCAAFFDVANLVAPPTRLFAPSIAARVLATAWQHSKAARRPGLGATTPMRRHGAPVTD